MRSATHTLSHFAVVLKRPFSQILTLMLHVAQFLHNVCVWIRSMKRNRKDLYFFTRINSENKVSIDRSLNRAMRGDFCGPAIYGTRETWPQEQVSDLRTTFRGTWQMRELRVHRSLERDVRDEPGSKVKFVLTRWLQRCALGEIRIRVSVRSTCKT